MIKKGSMKKNILMLKKYSNKPPKEKKKSIFLLKGIFVKNTVLGKTLQQALENIQELQLHS